MDSKIKYIIAESKPESPPPDPDPTAKERFPGVIRWVLMAASTILVPTFMFCKDMHKVLYIVLGVAFICTIAAIAACRR